MPEEITAEQLEMLLQMAVLPQPPYLMAGLGLLMGVLCGLTFGRQVQDKLDGWKQDRLPLLPLATAEISLSFTGILIGIALAFAVINGPSVRLILPLIAVVLILVGIMNTLRRSYQRDIYAPDKPSSQSKQKTRKKPRP